MLFASLAAPSTYMHHPLAAETSQPSKTAQAPPPLPSTPPPGPGEAPVGPSAGASAEHGEELPGAEVKVWRLF